MNLKLSAWFFLHDRKKFWSDFRKRLHILTLEKSQYYEECVRFYDTLDVKGKVVIDVGCDFGTTPMYFIKKGAVKVIGFSMDKQYFYDHRYKHFNCDVSPLIPSISTEINRIQTLTDKRRFVLKSDCEGCEWNFTQEFIEAFDDWIIAVHYPVANEELCEYIEEKGENIGNQQSGKCLGIEEIGIYKKKGKQ